MSTLTCAALALISLGLRYAEAANSNTVITSGPNARRSASVRKLHPLNDGTQRMGLKLNASSNTTSASLSARRRLNAPVQTYFVPLPEVMLERSFEAINPPRVTPPIETIIALAVSLDGTQIWYDHWEDGYDPDPTIPTQPLTTKIWGDGNCSNGFPPKINRLGVAFETCTDDILQGGDAIILENPVPISYPNPRNTAEIYYDGGDRIQSSNPVAVSRGAYPEEPGSLLAGAVEVWNTDNWGTTFEAPVGVGTSSDTNAWELSEMYLQAAEDDTYVTDPDNVVHLLNMGESLRLTGIQAGDVVSSTKPVQGHQLSADQGSRYEGRWFSLAPRDDWASEYVTPVSSSTKPTVVWLYNPHGTDLVISYEYGNGSSGTLPVSPGQGKVSSDIPDNYGARFWTVDNREFFGIVQVDAARNNGATSDWALPLVPRDFLTSQALIGWGYGCTDNECGRNNQVSVVYVSPLADAVIRVDYDGDGIEDKVYEVPYLESIKITDNNDEDMTGAVIWATDASGDQVDIAVAWGQDPSLATSAQSVALDLGTVVPPQPVIEAAKSVKLWEDVAPLGVYSPGDTLQFTIRIVNVGFVNIGPGGFDVTDHISPVFNNCDYVESSTVYNDGTAIFNIPDSASDTPFPLDEGFPSPSSIGKQGGAHEITFEAVVKSIEQLAPGEVSVVNEGVVTMNADPLFADYIHASVNFKLGLEPSIDIQKTVYEGTDGGSDCGTVNAVEEIEVPSGGPVTLCYVVTNTGNTYLSALEVNDADFGPVPVNLANPLAPGDNVTVHLDSTMPSSDSSSYATADASPTYSDGTTSAGHTETVSDLDDASLLAAPPLPTVPPSSGPTRIPTPAPSDSPTITNAPVLAKSMCWVDPDGELFEQEKAKDSSFQCLKHGDLAEDDNLEQCAVDPNTNVISGSVADFGHQFICHSSGYGLQMKMAPTYDPSTNSTKFTYYLRIGFSKMWDTISIGWEGDCCVRDAYDTNHQFDQYRNFTGHDEISCKGGVRWENFNQVIASSSEQTFFVEFHGDHTTSYSTNSFLSLTWDEPTTTTTTAPTKSLLTTTTTTTRPPRIDDRKERFLQTAEMHDVRGDPRKQRFLQTSGTQHACIMSVPGPDCTQQRCARVIMDPPTSMPTDAPTLVPSANPSSSPSTSSPTASPSSAPSSYPTSDPTSVPSRNPVADPEVTTLNRTISMDEDTIHTFFPADNAIVSSGWTADVVNVTNGTNGQVFLDPETFEVSYKPDRHWCGQDVFSYTACDPYVCDTAYVIVDVACVVDLPIAEPDFESTVEETPVLIPILDNDVGVESPLNISSVQETLPPRNGTIVVNANGTVTYTPDVGFVGSDKFNYQVCDEAGTCAETYVYLYVSAFPTQAPSAYPTAMPSGYPTIPPSAFPSKTSEPSNAPNMQGLQIIDANKNYSIPPHSVLRVTDPALGLLGGVTDPNNFPLMAFLISPPSFGPPPAIYSDGTFEYTPNPGFCGDDLFSYAVSNGLANSTEMTVNLTVECSTAEQNLQTFASDLVPQSCHATNGTCLQHGDAKIKANQSSCQNDPPVSACNLSGPNAALLSESYDSVQDETNFLYNITAPLGFVNGSRVTASWSGDCCIVGATAISFPSIVTDFPMDVDAESCLFGTWYHFADGATASNTEGIFKLTVKGEVSKGLTHIAIKTAVGTTSNIETCLATVEGPRCDKCFYHNMANKDVKFDAMTGRIMMQWDLCRTC